MKVFHRKVILIICCLFTGLLNAYCQFNPLFFPDFQDYHSNPIINYGDGFADAAWNDPCVLKVNGQYIMYLTAAEGIFLSPSNTVKVYRKVSSDGYNWTLSPSTPVLQPALGTYYEGGTETPSVVLMDSTYHMYLTCYPPGNNQNEFVIAHAVSSDGLNWTMDVSPVLESDGSATFYGDLVGEPGAMIYHDSICVFFTAAGIVNGIPVQSIGWMKSADGYIFDTPQQVVTLPVDVYPASGNYWGLSTPSALAFNDSIYLFTDVAQIINGNWTQVALHQFKTDGISGVWYHDTVPIHTMQDFVWTDGDYLSTLLAITPLMDDNGLLRVWYSGYRLADVVGTDTIYNVTFDSLGIMHVDPDFWGIGTSSYQFPGFTGAIDKESDNMNIVVYPNPVTDMLYIKGINGEFSVKVFDEIGRMLLEGSNNALDLSKERPGFYCVQIKLKGRVFHRLIIVE